MDRYVTFSVVFGFVSDVPHHNQNVVAQIKLLKLCDHHIDAFEIPMLEDSTTSLNMPAEKFVLGVEQVKQLLSAFSVRSRNTCEKNLSSCRIWDNQDYGKSRMNRGVKQNPSYNWFTDWDKYCVHCFLGNSYKRVHNSEIWVPNYNLYRCDSIGRV